MKEYSYVIFLRVLNIVLNDPMPLDFLPYYPNFFGDFPIYRMLPYIFKTPDIAKEFYQKEYKLNKIDELLESEMYGRKANESIKLQRFYDASKSGKLIDVVILELEIK